MTEPGWSWGWDLKNGLDVRVSADSDAEDVVHFPTPGITVSAVGESKFLVRLSTGAALVVGPGEGFQPVQKNGVWVLELVKEEEA